MTVLNVGESRIWMKAQEVILMIPLFPYVLQFSSTKHCFIRSVYGFLVYIVAGCDRRVMGALRICIIHIDSYPMPIGPVIAYPSYRLPGLCACQFLSSTR